ncbi:MAG: P1 family peptidase [Coriobacteriales bacterium]|nr:P1 family peptidase [Coriobacteriales bacterium]
MGNNAVLPLGFRMGSWTDSEKLTGCTVILAPRPAGALAGVDVRGAAPATRETDLLDPAKSVQRINAVFLSGGSAYGLGCAQGVMEWLRQHDCGFRFKAAGGSDQVVPIVCGASLYDLEVGDFSWPTSDNGWSACAQAMPLLSTGSVGAGAGATVGKLLGMEQATPSGLGAASLQVGGLQICAVSAVNALGNIYDPYDGSLLAGQPLGQEALYAMAGAAAGAEATAPRPHQPGQTGFDPDAPLPPFNTTISCITTNARLSKLENHQLAMRAHDAYALTIRPCHSSFDGDAIFCMSDGEVELPFDTLAELACQVLSAAIINAVCPDYQGPAD